MTIEDNSFLNSPTDAIDMHAGVVSGNYFSGAGYMPGAHADAIWVPSSTGTTITDNFIDGTLNADAPANANSDLRLTNEVGNTEQRDRLRQLSARRRVHRRSREHEHDRTQSATFR